MRGLGFLINCAIYGLFYKFMGYELTMLLAIISIMSTIESYVRK